MGIEQIQGRHNLNNAIVECLTAPGIDIGQQNLGGSHHPGINVLGNGSFEREFAGINPPKFWTAENGGGISDSLFQVDGAMSVTIPFHATNINGIYQQVKGKKGKFLVAAVFAKGAEANKVRLHVEGSVDGDLISQYHTGGGNWELLKGTSIALTADQTITFRLRNMNGSALACWFDQAILLITDYDPDAGGAPGPGGRGPLKFSGRVRNAGTFYMADGGAQVVMPGIVINNYPFRQAVTVKAMAIYNSAFINLSSLIITVLKNGVATLMTKTIILPGIGYFEDIRDVAFAAQDRIDVKVVANGIVGATAYLSVMIEFE